MTSSAIKKQVDTYLPLLSAKQKVLVLEMIKCFLNVDEYAKRTTLEQYNKELDEAVARIEQGKFVSHKDALKELSEW
jgi:vacuolar-type H+-ATPase subunit D/Vma8